MSAEQKCPFSGGGVSAHQRWKRHEQSGLVAEPAAAEHPSSTLREVESHGTELRLRERV